VAVKTGTSQGFRDAWAVSCSRDYVVAVWLGTPDNAPMNRVAGMVAAGYARQMMERLHPLQKEGIDERLFPPPEGAVPVDLCLLSGEGAGADCPTSSREWFLPSEAPRAPCSTHRRLAVDTATGTLADGTTPPDRIALKPYAVLSPEYALWGSRRGLGAPPPARKGLSSAVVLSPKDGARYLLDPDLGGRFQTIGLEAAVSPAEDTLSWFVDGAFFAESGYPHSVRFPLSRGRFLIEAVSSSGARSGAVVISVE